MNQNIYPIPIDVEVMVDPQNTIMSKTDLKGIIEYANDYFVEVCGYKRSELMGQPHNIIRHPDMPKVLFKIMWDTLNNGKPLWALVKNLTKEGKYYWVIARIEPKFDESGAMIAHYSHRKAAPAEATKKIMYYYNMLLEIETTSKLEVVEKFFVGLLEDLKLSYDDFLLFILGMTKEELESYFSMTNSTLNQNLSEKPIIKDYSRPIPTNEELKLNPSKVMMSKTNARGIIEYTNDYFIEVNGYPRQEVMGKTHSLVRNPDMPKTIFRIMWDTLKKRMGLFVIIKNLTKSGGYYWAISRIDPNFDEKGNVESFVAHSKAIPLSAITKIEMYYQVLISLEKEQSVEVAEKYFLGMLNERKLTYEEFILQILETSREILYTYFSEVLSLKLPSEKENIPIEISEPTPVEPKRPTPTTLEFFLDPDKVILSKTNPKGIIQYANEYFVEVSGYDQLELIGHPHNIIRHPDMPKSVFKLLWETIQKGENIHALLKNMTKSGSFYWVLTSFEIQYNDKGEISAYYAKRKAVPREAITAIEKTYSVLKNIEEAKGMDTAYNYLTGMLEDKNLSYNSFILNILNVSEEELKHYFADQPKEETATKKKGLFAKFFR
jgi:PAS domain S-box-containing protein